MDDILCETARALCVLAARLFGVRPSYGAICDFDLKASFGLTDAENAVFMERAHDEETLLAYEPTPDAVAGALALAAAGHRVDIVTGRPPFCARATEKWLSSAGLGAFEVTYVDKYGRFFVSDGAAPEAVSLERVLARRYDVVIEDSPVVLPAFADRPSTRVFVFDRPWNASYPLAPNMSRVRSWREIADRLGARIG